MRLQTSINTKRLQTMIILIISVLLSVLISIMIPKIVVEKRIHRIPEITTTNTMIMIVPLLQMPAICGLLCVYINRIAIQMNLTTLHGAVEILDKLTAMIVGSCIIWAILVFTVGVFASFSYQEHLILKNLQDKSTWKWRGIQDQSNLVFFILFSCPCKAKSVWK